MPEHRVLLGLVQAEAFRGHLDDFHRTGGDAVFGRTADYCRLTLEVRLGYCAAKHVFDLHPEREVIRDAGLVAGDSMAPSMSPT